jgi:hypothetical protein
MSVKAIRIDLQVCDIGAHITYLLHELHPVQGLLDCGPERNLQQLVLQRAHHCPGIAAAPHQLLQSMGAEHSSPYGQAAHHQLTWASGAVANINAMVASDCSPAAMPCVCTPPRL